LLRLLGSRFFLHARPMDLLMVGCEWELAKSYERKFANLNIGATG